MMRLLQTLAPALWIAGVAEFRRWPMGPVDYATIFVLLLALQTIRRRLRPQAQNVDFGKLKNPSLVAVLVGGITAAMALLLGGLFEAFARQPGPEHAPWWLRTGWHGACAFAISYFGFFARIEAWRSSQSTPNRQGPGSPA
jgi:hypothetical protein